MKTIALLLMLLGVLCIIVVGAMSLLVFAMTFDAPGSTVTPGIWLLSALVFLPVVLLVVVLIYAFIAYLSGNYMRSVWLGSVFGIAVLGGVAFFGITSITNIWKFRAGEAQSAEEARLYPEQRFVRPFEGGADTIIVFSNRIVAYRMPQRGDMPFAYSGPVGDLNEARNVIVIDPIFDRKIGLDEFPQFMDERGRRLTDVYSIR